MSEALEVIPRDLKPDEAEFVINSIGTICLENYEEIRSWQSDEDKISLFLQLISEWTFHKSIDLTRANVEKKLRTPIIKKIARTISGTLKREFSTDTTLEKILSKVEKSVKTVYDQSLEKLYNERKINELTLQNALIQSNIDKMSKQMRGQKNAHPFQKFQKTLSTVFQILKD